jgi:hypothetical protein
MNVEAVRMFVKSKIRQIQAVRVLVEAVRVKNIETVVTDATLTLQIISGLVSLTGVVVNTFSSRSEDSTGGLSSSLPAATAPSHVVTYRCD